MFGFLFKLIFEFSKGRRYCNKVADRLGVNRALYASALLERGVTWKHLEVYEISGVPVEQTIDLMIDVFEDGLSDILRRFGTQTEILQAIRAIEVWKVSRTSDAPYEGVDDETKESLLRSEPDNAYPEDDE